MNIDQYLLSLLAFSPIVGIVLLLFVKADRSRIIKGIGIGTTLIPLVLSLLLLSLYDFTEGGYQFAQHMNWIQFQIPLFETQMMEINYELAVDGLSVALIVLTAVISLLAAIASIYIKERWKEYFILFFILQIGMLGFFMSMNLFLFFIFFELTIIPMYFLIAIWGYFERERAANTFLIYNGIGSAFMLIAFVALLVMVGTLHIPDLTFVMAEEIPGLEGFKTMIFLGLLVAFGIKLPIFPFHSWVLRVHVQAPPAIVMIHSGVLLKLGAYGIVRLGMGMLPEQMIQFSYLMAILGVVNIIYGAILAVRQTDLKMVLAYSSISHMGIVLLGIAALNHSGMQGAVIQLISHGLISALLFFLVGAIYERTKTSHIDQLGGLATNIPVLAGVILAAGLANLGLPGMSGFISEFLAFMGLFDTYPWVAAVGVLGIILTAVYVLRAILNSTFGPAQEKWAQIRDARPIEYVPMTVLLGLIILIGVYPAAVTHMIDGSIETILHGLLARIGG